MPWSVGPSTALDYPVRCITECFPEHEKFDRALDIGCAVGRSSFEFSRCSREVVGIDYSQAFVDACKSIKSGQLTIPVLEEGATSSTHSLSLLDGVHPERVQFEQGDACDLRPDIGVFDAILMANLIDRLYDPFACLERLKKICRFGGRLVITSPYTWMEAYTPREKWLCSDGNSTLEGMKKILEPEFTLQETKNLPFLIREHRRKYQWSMAEASIWVKR